MLSNSFKWTLAGLFLAVTSGTFLLVRLDNRRLQRSIAAERPTRDLALQLRIEAGRTRTQLARGSNDRESAERAMQAELEQARSEVADLERRAHAARHTGDSSSALNRDPERGLVPLEHFRSVGRASPAAAFQTFVWAAMKGDDATLASTIFLSDGARDQVSAIVAALPDADRGTYSTPEKLVALFFADALTTMPAAQVVGVSFTDTRHAVLRVRGLTPNEQQIPLRLEQAGWQIAFAEHMATKLEGWLHNSRISR